MMWIAHQLGKTVPEMRAMAFNEFCHWRAFFNIQQAQEKRRINNSGLV